jgi:hypothetical protein
VGTSRACRIANSRGSTLIAMMQAADFGEGNNIAGGGKLHATRPWAVLHDVPSSVAVRSSLTVVNCRMRSVAAAELSRNNSSSSETSRLFRPARAQAARCACASPVALCAAESSGRRRPPYPRRRGGRQRALRRQDDGIENRPGAPADTIVAKTSKVRLIHPR